MATKGGEGSEKPVCTGLSFNKAVMPGGFEVPDGMVQAAKNQLLGGSDWTFTLENHTERPVQVACEFQSLNSVAK